MHAYQSLFIMDQIYRKPVLQRELRVLNQKEDRDLQHKLDLLDKQYRYTRKMLQQRRDLLIKEQRRVVIVKVCEPKATINIAMKEIGEHKNAETHSRGIHTSDGRISFASKTRSHDNGSELVEQSRSISAPPASVTVKTSSVRHRGNVQSNLSLMQMKNIAAIDSISEKELARQKQKAQEEMERLRQFQNDALHEKVAAFIEKLKDKSEMELLQPP